MKFGRVENNRFGQIGVTVKNGRSDRVQLCPEFLLVDVVPDLDEVHQVAQPVELGGFDQWRFVVRSDEGHLDGHVLKGFRQS